MRIVRVLSFALAGLSVIGTVAAYAQSDARSQYVAMTRAVVDEKGNLVDGDATLDYILSH